MRLRRHDRFLPGWVAGLLTAALIAAIVGLSLVFGGLYDISANTPHSRLVAWAIHSTMIHSVRRQAGRAPAPTAASAMLLSGAREYDCHCVACHGGPGVDRAPWASAMLPTPPFLIDASARWNQAELVKIVHDGVKMTAMPAWGEVEPDDRIAAVVAFLDEMPRMSPERFRQLQLAARTHDRSSPCR
jgi:mono/diheme cytochrome c family protein